VTLIDQAVEKTLQHPEADSLRSVSWPIQTPYKMWHIDEDGYLKPLLHVDGLPDAHSMPRQMLPEVFWQNGYVDVIRPRAVLEQNSMCGSKVLPFVVHEPIYEIDYPESIPVVEAALERLARGESPVEAPGEQVTRYPM
jgi:N-acylneuraminate cytidylyltransferase